MKNKKDYRKGQRSKNKQGLTMEIVRYNNNKAVEIVFLETGEHKVVRYVNFCSGNVKANLIDYPYLVVKKAKAAYSILKNIAIIFAVLAAITVLTILFR